MRHLYVIFFDHVELNFLFLAGKIYFKLQRKLDLHDFSTCFVLVKFPLRTSTFVPFQLLWIFETKRTLLVTQLLIDRIQKGKVTIIR